MFKCVDNYEWINVYNNHGYGVNLKTNLKPNLTLQINEHSMKSKVIVYNIYL